MAQIEVKNGVTWDTEMTRQSEEALAWLREEIYPQLAMNARETELVIPTTDKWGRPLDWEVETESCVVRIKREYVDSDRGTWSRRRDVVTVAEKGGER